jgi:hypothetical protein
MPRTLAVILTIFAVLALAGALFFDSLDPDPRQGDGVAPLAAAKERVPALEPDGERRLVEAPPTESAEVDAAPAAEVDDITAPVPLGFAPYEAPYKIPGEFFEAKYGGMTLEELAAHRGMVEVEYHDALFKISDARDAAGLYEEYVVEPPEDPAAELDLPPWPEHKGLTIGQRTESLEDGRVQVRRSVIPYAEQPDHYALKDELFWLIRRISKLQQGH